MGPTELLDGWVRRDQRVIVLHRPASGLVDTLNAGLSLCSAPLVARMDADDISHPRRFELQAAVFWITTRASDGFVLWFVISLVPGWGRGFRIYEAWLNSLATPEAIARERFVESPVAHPSAMVRKELLEDFRVPRNRQARRTTISGFRLHGAGR